MSKNGNFNIYLNILVKKLRNINDSRWDYLYNEHLIQALNFYRKGKNKKSTYFRDCISRSNKIFEGIIRLLYDVSLKFDNSLQTQSNRIFTFINNLIKAKKIPTIFYNKLDDYRDDYRNPETHDIFRIFGEKEAEKALNEALIFLNIGLDNYNLIKKQNVPIDDRDYLYLIFDTFIQSFAIYSNFFKLYDKRYNGIYSEHINSLLNLLKNYYKTSIFNYEFILEKHPLVKKLRPHLKISLDNQELTFTIIKVTEYDLIKFNQTYWKLTARIETYVHTFNNLYFLIWSFTNRTNLVDILSLFYDVPHFHLFGLKDPEQKILSDFFD